MKHLLIALFFLFALLTSTPSANLVIMAVEEPDHDGLVNSMNA